MLFVISFSLSAQLMGKIGFINTFQTGGGNANDDKCNEFDGFQDTFQARLAGIGGLLVIDTMLQWKAETSYTDTGDFERMKFSNSKCNVNILVKAVKNVDFGIGTYLNWKFGPSPARTANPWEPQYHSSQGGLSYGLPGSAPVTGATYYANHVTETPETKKSLALRISAGNMFRFAAAVPDKTDTDSFMVNAAAEFTPNEKLLAAAGYNGICKGDGNLYAGGTFFFTDFLSLDSWIALDNLGGERNNGKTGAGGSLAVSLQDLTLRPETGVTVYENSDYTPSWYTGISFLYEINETLTAELWSSFADGSKNRDWCESSATEDWTGGSIFDIRPLITYYFKSTDAFTSSFEYRYIITYKNESYHDWSVGGFWVHLF